MKLYYDKGDIAFVGKPLIDIETDENESTSQTNQNTQQETKVETKLESSQKITIQKNDEIFNKVKTSPAVRRIARENNINLSEITPTGPNGRILKEDVLKFINEKLKENKIEDVKIMEKPTSYTTEDRREPVRGLRRTMIKTMTAAGQVPTFGLHEEYIIDKLIEAKNMLQPLAKEEGIKLSFMPFFIKAASLALLKFPIVNSQLSNDLSEIIFKGSHNIGIAMDTPQGLLVPNIKNCEKKSLFEIAKELNRLTELGRQGKLGPDDLNGGTFTLSNIGMIAGTYARPLLVVPQSTIGAIGKIRKVPAFNEVI